MDLLKKHFEKILLLVLLLLFAGMMIYLLDIIRSTEEITDADLQIPTPEANYKQADEKARQFDFGRIFTSFEGKDKAGKTVDFPLVWRETPPRDSANKDFYSDLTDMYQASVCVNCGKIVSLFYFSGKKCPLCGGELLAPRRPVIVKVGGLEPEFNPDLDTDKDGMPDIIETKLGLNPKDATDAKGDLDGDGFVNIYEYVSKTDLHDPLSHPALHLALRVAGFERIKLPVVLQNVTGNGKTCQLGVYITQDGETKLRSRFYGRGDVVELDGRDYRLSEIKPIFRTVDVRTENESEVRFINKDGDIIFMKVGHDVYAPHQKVLFEYMFDSERRICYAGDRFKIGDEKVGVENFTVKSLDNIKQTATIVNDKDKSKKEIVIGMDYAMPKKYRSSKSASPTDGTDAVPADGEKKDILL